ncbi:3-oxoacyl-[acyl-carrier-protein] synthase III [Burkholderiales bacterium]|nr:3-oxoacyl-[acyl-carrier-protein] synthase III [Burkholderiales bacterium]
MAAVTLERVRIRGLASCVPKASVGNLDCAEDKRSERERLVRNIGILTRRICYPWQFFSDLAKAAAERLLDAVEWTREEIDALIVVTQSPDYLIPATAIIIQDRMKLPTTTIAYDINLGCSGYPFGIYTVGSMLSSGGIKKALLLVGDKCASLNDPLFSDCGTATALEFDPGAPPIHFDLNSDGSGYRAIILPVGGHREPTQIHHLLPRRDADGETRRDADLILDGTAVLNFSTQRVPPALRSLCEYAKTPLESIDYFVLHQANRMINETIRKKLQLAPEKVPSTLYDFGNTSSASVPLTMTVRLRDALTSGPATVLMSGFGIGLSWGSCIVRTEGIVMPELVVV